MIGALVVAAGSAIGCRAPAAPTLGYVTGGVAQGPAPVVVAVHGLGDRPESLVTVVEACGLPVRVVAPRAPSPHHDGFSWFGVRFEGEAVQFEVDEVRDAGDRLAALIERLGRDPETVGRPVVTGFSQGGVLSFVVAARHPGVVGLAVPIAGLLPPELAPAGGGPDRPRIRAVHGAEDPLVPADAAIASVDGLRAAGWDARIRIVHGVAHEVSAVVHREVCEALASALPP